MQYAFFLNTTPDIFAHWLEDRSRLADMEQYPTEKGRIALDRARYNRQTGVVSMAGHYIKPSGEDSETAYPISEVLTFKIIPLAPERIEVQLTCRQPVVSSLVQTLLHEIGTRWPEASVGSATPPPPLSIEAALGMVLERQEALYALLGDHDRRTSDAILRMAKAGQLTANEMTGILDAIKAITDTSSTKRPELHPNALASLQALKEVLSEDASIEHKLELSIPLIPFILQYKGVIAIAAKADVGRAIDSLEAWWNRLAARSAPS
jgi:hypothetical protein